MFRSPRSSADLGIADLLADRAMTARQIAATVGSDPDSTHRLLRAAVSYGLCTMHRRTGAVKLARTGTVLSGDHTASVREWTRYMALRSTAEAWSGLTASIRTGQSAFAAVHAMSVWKWFGAHRDEERLFASAMRQATQINASTIALAYPWPDRGVVCDVAGGIGTLLTTIVASSAVNLRGVLVDAPAVIDEAEGFLAESGLADRIDRVAGDIFGNIDATADVYLLKDVLHDWDDERCDKILATVVASMPRGSRLVLVEIVQHPNSPNPLAPWADLQMLTQTDGGRQRSVGELSALLAGAGLRLTGRVFSAMPHTMVEAQQP
ncbi:MAG: methyltransferase [Mycobacterium sp.]